MKRSGIGLLLVVLAAFVAAPFSLAVDAIDFSKGAWHRAALGINDENEIPFLLWLPAGEGDAVIRNGDEDIRVKFERRPPGNWHDAMHGFVLDFPHYDSRIEAEYDLTYHYRGVWRKGTDDEVVAMSFYAHPISQEPSEFIRVYKHFDREQSAAYLECGKDLGDPVGDMVFQVEFELAFESEQAALTLLDVNPLVALYDGQRQQWLGSSVTATLQFEDREPISLAGISGSPMIMSYFDGGDAFLLQMRESRGNTQGVFHSANLERQNFSAWQTNSIPNFPP